MNNKTRKSNLGSVDVVNSRITKLKTNVSLVKSNIVVEFLELIFIFHHKVRFPGAPHMLFEMHG